MSAPHHAARQQSSGCFFVDDDRTTYFGLLKEESEKYGLSVDGYCLMTNHIHLIATPEAEKSLAKALGRTHFRYTQYVNRFHKRSGHLWQNRFYSCVLDEEHYWRALAYGAIPGTLTDIDILGEIRQIPPMVRLARLVVPGLPHHITQRGERRQQTFFHDEDYATIAAPATRLRSTTFVHRLEQAAGRLLRPRKPGRPAKLLKQPN